VIEETTHKKEKVAGKERDLPGVKKKCPRFTEERFDGTKNKRRIQKKGVEKNSLKEGSYC